MRTPRPSGVTLIVAAVVAGWLAAGPGGAVAAGLLAATARRQLRARTENRESLAAVDGLAEALRTLVAGLRSGAHPAAAAEAAAEDAQPQTVDTMRAMAAAARLDGDMATALAGARTPALATALARIAKAWQLAQRHGLPLADVLDAVRGDLEQRTRFARQVLARMTGPKSSAAALSLLPVLGIGLGEAVGASPLRMLTGTGPGQVLLLAGVTLLCAGVIWSGRITSQVALR
ncbi:type II secretion system F family protein [Actinophytocola algeriensis]|uniref:Tight adherence protein B n=1 Tax=Actinophytocola algeriensis TaxID=1768010 RepID=A0A7W7Q5C1_9PSEU|nr:type II secretion system F family protein [Actinophytocola algeriensis]MBB4907177.1 tight adherence protein B [Actinophytocola algeriensis]MBE1478660.1 tight adherence protein B [Actinophytocola algeriensis]